MLTLRQMKTIKALKDGNKLYVKGSILKSFSSKVTRTATLLFVDIIPQKCFCECPIGKCGLCCHVTVILLHLEHFTNFNQPFLPLCTQKLEKRQRPTKGSKNLFTYDILENRDLQDKWLQKGDRKKSLLRQKRMTLAETKVTG